MRPVNKKQIFIGIIPLILGLLVYFVDRPPGDTYFVHKIIKGFSLHNIIPDLFGSIGRILPAFIHVFSLSLITAGILGCAKRGYVVICSSWLAIDIAFELGQKFDSWASSLIPDFSGIPFLEASKDFFISGTFDYYDIVAMVLGAIAACIIMFNTMPRRITHEVQ